MSDSDSSEKDSVTRLPKGDVATLGGADGIRVEYSGVAVAPVKGTLRSEGFQDTPFTLDQHTKSDIRIPMKPLSTSAGKSVEGGPKQP